MTRSPIELSWTANYFVFLIIFHGSSFHLTNYERAYREEKWGLVGVFYFFLCLFQVFVFLLLILFGLVTCPCDQRLKVQADREREEDSLTQLFFINSIFYQFYFLSIRIYYQLSVFFKRWKVQADREREKKTLWPSFYLFLCSSLYLLISVSSYVTIDIWRQGIFIFMSDHLHI